jgi:hypothetical protein
MLWTVVIYAFDSKYVKVLYNSKTVWPTLHSCRELICGATARGFKSSLFTFIKNELATIPACHQGYALVLYESMHSCIKFFVWESSGTMNLTIGNIGPWIAWAILGPVLVPSFWFEIEFAYLWLCISAFPQSDHIFSSHFPWFCNTPVQVIFSISMLTWNLILLSSRVSAP